MVGKLGTGKAAIAPSVALHPLLTQSSHPANHPFFRHADISTARF